MAVIVKKMDGKPVFNALNIKEEEKERALRLDKVLAKRVPEIEKEWLAKRIKKGSGTKIDVELAYNIGKKLSKIVDDENLVSPGERQWVWKAIREMYLKENLIKARGKTFSFPSQLP